MAAPTAAQMNAVDSSLKAMTANDDAIHKNGAILFSSLFKMKESSLQHFNHFKKAGMGSDYFEFISTHAVGKKHSEAVLNGLRAILAAKDDSGQLQDKAQKLAKSHEDRGIKADTFKLMFDVFPVYLKEIGMGDDATVQGWITFIKWLGTFF